MNQSKNSRKKWLWLGGGLLAVLLLAAVILWPRAAGLQAQDENGDAETAVAFTGDLSASATAAGQVVAQQSAALALNRAGRVAAVHVAAGDAVQAGDVLLQLETAALERAVLSAQQGVAIQEANLATLLAPPSAADVAAAEAGLASAEAGLARLLAGPTAAEIASAEAGVRAAQADLNAAYARLNSATPDASAADVEAAEIELELARQAATTAAQEHSTVLVTEPNQFLTAERLADMEEAARLAAVQANADLAAAEQALADLRSGDPNSIAARQAGVAAAAAQRDAAQAQRDLLLAPASAAQIAAAQASVAQAQASLDQLQRDPPAWQITQAEVQLAQAQISLQRAEQDLANATLVAPFAGVVTAVSVAEGEVASGILVELVDSASLEVVLDVDEIDLANITVGQPAVVTLESWPDTPIDSEVTAVAPQAAQSPGSALVTYDVSLSLAATDLPVRIGMTANASLVTDARTDVLLVPNSAITIDRTTGRAAVYVVQADGTVVETAVSIGLRDAQHTQIVSGLNAGDRVRLNYTPPAQEDGGFGPPGGGGGPFGG